MAKREFRKAPSLAAERVSRNLISRIPHSEGIPRHKGRPEKGRRSNYANGLRHLVIAESSLQCASSSAGVHHQRETYAASELISEVKNNAWVEQSKATRRGQ